MNKFTLNEIVKIDHQNTWRTGIIYCVRSKLWNEGLEVDYDVALDGNPDTVVKCIDEDHLYDMQECYKAQFGI